MTTVRDATYDFLRRRGMTTMFGNPGSTELPMLAGFPDDFTYVLGLQEAVAVGMADGYAQASGRPTMVNLHTAPGVGNGMGAIFNAQANKSPLLVTAGQQARSLMTLQANLTNRDAARMPHPLVKWSYEPPRAEDVPHALARATHLASLPPRGPVFVSIPMDDWDAEVDEGAVAHQTGRNVIGRAVADPEVVRDLAARLDAAENPMLVAGPDVDASGAWDTAVAPDPISPSTAVAGLGDGLPEHGSVVVESPSATLALRNQLRLSKPGSYYFGAGGGLGFGLAAAIGVQLAQPERPVVCVVGEGSAQYAITGFWTAAAYGVPVTFLVLRNEEYSILKWFADVEEVTGAPGLDLPALEVAQVAEAYGVSSQRVTGREELHDALQGAVASEKPELVEVPVAPGMALF